MEEQSISHETKVQLIPGNWALQPEHKLGALETRGLTAAPMRTTRSSSSLDPYANIIRGEPCCTLSSTRTAFFRNQSSSSSTQYVSNGS